ncbi:beta-ketoacyl-ACP synthase III [Sulfuriroseicoccus oceanibius]|uniref:Beta-ketoacyl-[acyl-carrier-protein] synthase III n=1 Tax=Sulfuriroseicoccus oceanibius TaxID=2707525 RepID=A0A6B3L0Z1_9BACT|nr:beta-ketoacyl-ACP synthase III [Sulfuriroseicoccus oceanibius]QQL46295.1 ketoacyl-ACP synthase III [Sulfuriroseicoccus oceanibius]
MSEISLYPVQVAGTGSYVPEKVLTNADLEKLVDTSDEWITTRTGIKERRIAADDQATSDLATAAAKAALEDAGITAADLDLIIVGTVTPDMAFPATACFVQQKLGAKKAVAYDVSAACSGFLYAMNIAAAQIGAGAIKNALIIGAEKLSSLVNWNDRNTCVLFGDGAGAAVLTRGTEDSGKILATRIGTDGRQTGILKVPCSGTAPAPGADDPSCETENGTIFMAGREVFKHAVTAMKKGSLDVIADAGLQPGDIAKVIPHQANLRIIEAIRERLDLPEERMFVNLQKYGNTSAAAVAIALDEAHKTGAIQRGDNIVLVVFGAGLTWAAATIEW